MIRNRNNCYSTTAKDKYPFDEVLIFFSEGGTSDIDEVLLQELSAVSSLDALLNRKEIYFHSIEFAGYDTSEHLLEKGANAEKDFANEIVLGNMLTSSWQPNYCRPIVRINGINITSSISTFDINSADFSRSIGLPLPFCLTINKVIKEPRTIEILGSLAQRTCDGYRNYPLLAILNFWHNFN